MKRNYQNAAQAPAPSPNQGLYDQNAVPPMAGAQRHGSVNAFSRDIGGFGSTGGSPGSPGQTANTPSSITNPSRDYARGGNKPITVGTNGPGINNFTPNLQPVAPGQGQGQSPGLAAMVRQIGSKTFYYKNNRWIDSTVKPEDDAKAVVIAQFSDQFFDLARSQTPEMNQYLTFTEPVTVNLDGRVYRFDPSSP